MEEIATFLLVLVLGGGTLLVLLVVGLVSGVGGRARLKEVERELLAMRQGVSDLQGRIGYLEAELAKARVAVSALWKSVESAQHALPPAPAPAPAANVLAPIKAAPALEAPPPVPIAAAAPAPKPIAVAEPAPKPVAAIEPAAAPVAATEPAPAASAETVTAPAVEPTTAPEAKAVTAPAVEPATAPEAEAVTAPAAEPVAPEAGPDTEPAPAPVAEPVAEPAPAAPVDHTIPEPPGWKSPSRPATSPLQPRPQQPRPQPAPELQAARSRPAEPPPSVPGVPMRIDWERWIGVRGAAALGAGVLVIAGLYFFKYSLDNGLIPPSFRVALGTLVGLGAIGGSEVNRRRDTPVLANWLAGAGIAILYIAFWSAHAVYDLVDMPVAFGLMALVTVACGLLSVRHGLLVIALLGLAGGFSTPLALSSGSDRPLGLFGYLLLLDVALLYLAKKRSWPVLGALSLVGTFLYQVLWVGVRMGTDSLVLGMGIVLVFGGVFAAAVPRGASGEDKEGGLWTLTRAASTLLPFGFGIYFGLRSDLGEHLYPLGLMLVLLVAGASWIARARNAPWMHLAAAIAGVTVLGTWLARHDASAIPWETTGLFVLFGAIVHGFLELERARPREPDGAGIGRAAGAASLGPLLLLIFAAASPSSPSPWPWLLGMLVLAALTLRHAGFDGREQLHLVVGLVLGLGLPIVYAAHAGDLGVGEWPRADVFLGVVIATALALQAIALFRPGAEVRRWATHGAAAATLLAFAVALHVGARTDLGEHLYPLLPMLTVLAAGAAWLARERGAGWLHPATALAGLAVIATWIARHAAAPVAIEIVLLTSLFAGVFHAALELQRALPRAGASAGVSAGAETASLGALLLLVVAAAEGSSVVAWPWIAGWILLTGLTLRHAGFEGKERLHLGPAILLGIGFPLVHAAHDGDAACPAASVWLGLVLAAAIGLQIVAQVRQGEARRWASHAAGVLALLLMLDALVVSPTTSPALTLLTIGLLGFLALVSAARLGSGGWTIAATLVTAIVDSIWALRETDHTASVATVALVGQGLTVALFMAWPIVARARFLGDRWAWRSAALAGPIWFGSLYACWGIAFGKGAIGLLPILIAFGTLGAGAAAQGAWEAGSPIRRSALAWLLGVTVAFVSVAVPLQLENEWITAGWALEGVALLALWKRLDHAGLKYVGLGHLAVVTVRLVANPWVLEYHPRAEFPIVNWLAYTYWIPALSLLGAWYLLRELEAPRLRPWEVAMNAGRRAPGAVASVSAAIIILFLWVNLTIVDAFSTGTELHLSFERLPARDLTLSMAWAVYALILLAVGMVRGSAALRWTSLALIIVTIGKVFLYDLAHLHDLYRVASLVGLAFSLILISLAYQRFVFGKRKQEAA